MTKDLTYTICDIAFTFLLPFVWEPWGRWWKEREERMGEKRNQQNLHKFFPLFFTSRKWNEIWFIKTIRIFIKWYRQALCSGNFLLELNLRGGKTCWNVSHNDIFIPRKWIFKWFEKKSRLNFPLKESVIRCGWRVSMKPWTARESSRSTIKIQSKMFPANEMFINSHLYLPTFFRMTREKDSGERKILIFKSGACKSFLFDGTFSSSLEIIARDSSLSFFCQQFA